MKAKYFPTRSPRGGYTLMAVLFFAAASFLILGAALDWCMTNAKLTDRSERLVMEIANVGREAARKAIEGAGGSVKVAIVMLRRGSPRKDAEQLLAVHQGRLRPIIGDPPQVTG